MCLAYQSGSGTRFKYEHNPMDNPKAAMDIIENPDAVYGFSPNSESTRIGKYADKALLGTLNQQVILNRQLGILMPSILSTLKKFKQNMDQEKSVS